GLIDTPGNYVILKVSQNGKNYYVLYAHLQPGSIRVKAGDKVKQGQVIGNLGNTGNSSAPHLHMHVTTGNDPLKSDGVPFVFEKMILQGKAKTIDDDYGLWLPPSGPDKTIEAVIPSANQVIHFSDTAQTKCPD